MAPDGEFFPAKYIGVVGETLAGGLELFVPLKTIKGM
jgi:hypothetical protein